jgi:hypothetical protein
MLKLMADFFAGERTLVWIPVDQRNDRYST